MVRRIHELLKDIKRNPHSGLGKPEPLRNSPSGYWSWSSDAAVFGLTEPLRHSLSGYWSRRIDQEHRLVYRVTDQGILLAQMRYHY